ncbi:sulfatase-like hydrolase/transferase [Streptosporangium soli]|nr:sulfatase-like hydrolase/transferase [Streptosporangium sp. KLBMP 9127]
MSTHSPSRRAFIAGTGGLVTTALVGAGQAGLPDRPNIVLVLADDLGWGQLGCYGQDKIKTPTLDRLAAEGLRFTSAYSGAPLCAPSRAALLTGLHTGHATVRENPEGGTQHSLTSSDLTFANLLKLAGYRTACFGKWGFGPETPAQPSHPNSRGFDEFFGFIGHKHAHQYWPDYLWHNQERVHLGRRSYAPDLFLQRAKEFIRESADEPFLLYFPTTLPHAPSQVPGGTGEYADRPWTRANRGHAAQVTRLDTHVAEIIRTLREAGVADSTVLLFAGDNGPHREKGVTPGLFDSNGPFRADKRDLYEGGIRVPMIAWSPSLPRRGEVVEEQVASWDVLPTLADLAGLPLPDHLDGRSFSGLLTGSGHTGHDYLFWNRPRKAQAVRRGRWKAVRFAPGIAGAGASGRFELYDLRTDLGERRNLTATRPEIAAELNALMDASVGPDPRTPYGLRVTAARTGLRGEPHEMVVRLHNGSAVSWNDVHLSLDVPPGWRATGDGRRAVLMPGDSITTTFTVTAPAGRTSLTRTLLARARFDASGRRVRFRSRRKLTVVHGAAV